jgi:hypothetical protein
MRPTSSENQTRKWQRDKKVMRTSETQSAMNCPSESAEREPNASRPESVPKQQQLVLPLTMQQTDDKNYESPPKNKEKKIKCTASRQSCAV